jgi:hypothetical protein
MWEFLTNTFKMAFQKTTAASFILALIAALVIAVIAGLSFGELTSIWPPAIADGPSRHIMLTGFVIAFLVLMPVFYILILKEGDDYLTPLRQELKGNWSVFYQDWEVGPTGDVISTEQNDTAKLDINVVTRKLYIQSRLHNHPVFENYERNIESISINPSARPIEVIFFYRLGLKTRNGRSLEGDTFVKLLLEFDEQNKPVRMIGRWYDLDGEFAASKKQYYETLTGKTLPNEFRTSGEIRYEKL